MISNTNEPNETYSGTHTHTSNKTSLNHTTATKTTTTKSNQSNPNESARIYTRQTTQEQTQKPYKLGKKSL